jgi:intracellular sulfur oxidation DsrE/DsrF family protein
MTEKYNNSQRRNQSSNAEVTGNSIQSEVDGGNSRTSYEDGNITYSPTQLIELDELENMDLDDGNIEYPSLSSIKSSGPPNLFINPMGNNQNHKIQFTDPTVVGGINSDTVSGSQTTTNFDNQMGKGEVHEPSGSTSENISVSSSFQNNFTSSTMKSQFAPVVQTDSEDSERETIMMMEDIHRQIRRLLVSDDPDAANKILTLKAKSTTLNAMLTEIRNMAPKDQSVKMNMMANNQGQTHLLTMMEQNKFKVPMDKIPKFDIEICNYATQTYQIKALDKISIVSYRTVEDFIETFESIFVFYNTDIDKHWDKALKQSFITSMDMAPRDWLLYEIKVNKHKYKCWNDMKKKLLKKYLETYTDDDYVGQLFLLRQSSMEPLMNYLQRYVILLTKAKMQDTHNKAIECFMSLQSYVRTYLKEKLPELRSVRNNDHTSCPDPLLPHENLHSLMELLESHTHSIHRELADKHAIESDKRSRAKMINDNKKRTRLEDETPNEDTPSPTKRVDRKDFQRPYQPFTGNPTRSLCDHCKRVEYVPGHQCPERSEYYRRHAETKNALPNNNRTVNPANVNMVRSAKSAVQLDKVTAEAIEDTEDVVKTLADILKKYNPISAEDDLMEYVDQSLATESPTNIGTKENNGN